MFLTDILEPIERFLEEMKGVEFEDRALQVKEKIDEEVHSYCARLKAGDVVHYDVAFYYVFKLHFKLFITSNPLLIHTYQWFGKLQVTFNKSLFCGK